MRRLLRTLVVLVGLAASTGPALAESIAAGLSATRVEIESNFVGTDITVFGSIERDAATVARRGGYDVVVVVRGPLRDVITRRKGRFAGVWLNRDSLRFRNVPTYYGVVSNRALALVADPALLNRFGIGLTSFEFLTAEQDVLPAERIAFQTAMVRLKINDGLYRELPTGVEMMTPTLFKSQIELPSNIATGTYTANIFLFGDGALLAREQLRFDVRKSGFEAAVSTLSRRNPLAYGLAAVLVAVAAGWVAGLVFRSG